MARKSSKDASRPLTAKDASRALEDYPAWIRNLGYERCMSGQQILHHTTHKPLPRYRDMNEYQRRELLVCAELWGKKIGKPVRFRYWEKRLLAKAFKPDGTTLALLAMIAGLALCLIDRDKNGIADIVQFCTLPPAEEKFVKENFGL